MRVPLFSRTSRGHRLWRAGLNSRRLLPKAEHWGSSSTAESASYVASTAKLPRASCAPAGSWDRSTRYSRGSIRAYKHPLTPSSIRLTHKPQAVHAMAACSDLRRTVPTLHPPSSSHWFSPRLRVPASSQGAGEAATPPSVEVRASALHICRYVLLLMCDF
jgi:hypothetical protein